MISRQPNWGDVDLRSMRYWAYFAGKLTAAAALLFGLLVLVDFTWPENQNGSALAPLRDGQQILVYYLLLMGWFLLCAGVLAAITLDQRRRCRVCVHRLVMPVGTGSWGRMLLFGTPRTEYICPYGHGTLKMEELQISGLQAPEWTPHSGDFWEELCASSKESGQRP